MLFTSVITTVRKSSYSGDIFRFTSLFLMTTAMCLNVSCLLLILQYIDVGNFNSLLIKFFNNKVYDVLLSFMLFVYLPTYLINYFLIFHNEKYISIEKRYSKANNKIYSAVYLTISWLLFFSLLIALRMLKN